jgi:hypothetical protein
MPSNRLVVIHFSPLEFYPPIQNLLNELGRASSGLRVSVLSSPCPNSKLHSFKSKSVDIKISRIGFLNKNFNMLVRYFNYLSFFSFSFLKLIFTRPKRILYFETISCLPAYLYKRFIDRRCEILIHYHEYATLGEYKNGMVLVKKFHEFEKWLYPNAVWVSHTNNFRMELFKKDIFPIELKSAQLLPNYPPSKWKLTPKNEYMVPLRVVYVGSLSLTTMYTAEFSNWVISQQGKIVWDVYSFNFTGDAVQFIKGLNTKWITIKEGIDYDKLPSILKNYDVGVILYKGHISNYIYNAPNKLFEYLASGLDVWFPNVMVGSLEYVTNDAIPKVISIDFSDLKTFNLRDALKRETSISENSFFCEIALAPLITYLHNNS